MDPHAARQKYIQPGHVYGHGRHALSRAFDRLDQFLAQVLPHERITDLQFTLNRVLEQDGLVNAQVRWRKTWVDAAGKPGKAEGVSEFILKPEGRSFRILRIGGDALF